MPRVDIPYYGDYYDGYEYDGDSYTGHGTDDGVDACKDANAEMGYRPYDPRGFFLAKKNGWIKKKTKDDDE